jgi:hypothetical protein
MADVHEFISARFMPDIGYAEQLETVSRIGERLSHCPGMRRRDYYFNEDSQLWLAHVTWDSEDSIEAANKRVERPEDARLFRRFDTTAILYERFEMVGSHAGQAVDS